MANIVLTVVVCTHNPRPAYIARVLAALEAQTLPRADWELLLVDNASAEPLADRYDISWHPAGHHLREDELGLGPARVTGMAQSRGDVIVFVDDDNVLAPDYLAEALRIARTYPFLGAWGGTMTPEFETAPPAWARRYWPWLIREVKQPVWSNDPEHWVSQPCGAGMCVRRQVAEAYVAEVATSPLRARLGRRGRDLISGEDTDLALESSTLGLGWGMLPSLRLTHIIPSGRMEERYLRRLGEGVSLARTYLMIMRGLPVSTPSLWRRIIRFGLQSLRLGPRHARIGWACDRGTLKALRMSESLPTGAPIDSR